MKMRGIRTFCVAALVLAGAFPAAADVTAMTCADFMALDSPEKKAMAGEMLAWLAESDNAGKMPNLEAKYATSSGGEGCSPENFVIEIEGHFKDADPGTGVFERLNSHS